MSSVIEEIAHWIAKRDDFSDLARTRAKQAVSDTFACMVAGCDDFSTKAVRSAFALSIGTGGEASVTAGGRSTAAVAALVGATAAHALDFDDNFKPGMSHASAVLVPALLAVAEATGTDGHRLIDSYLVGLQVQAFVGAGVGPSHYTAGWHGTSTIGCIGTAAGVAWLMGLDTEGISRALSIAVSMAAGVKGQFGTPIKPLHAGLAARNAVEAASLALSGMTGRLDILERQQGFLELFGGADPKGWDLDQISITTDHVIETIGVIPKRHPCCGSTHLVVDMILDLKTEVGFEPDDVMAVETLVGIANQRNLAYPEPVDEMEARFSMQYCVARAIAKGRLELSDFTPEAVSAHGRDSLLQRVTMRSYSAEAEKLAGDSLPHRLTLKLRDCRTFDAERSYAKGAISEQFTDEDRVAKFLDCCRELGTSYAADLFERLESLERESDVRFLGRAIQEAPEVHTPRSTAALG
ncbi:MmgE/PrpD family protein [Microvirga puerhi]|uniref:MmgE/PrpD family protein n=1 Tax=Microvirga puerhi TaxID=2876078 RepID=A0ABS7VT32_9HYPH|nr:MmgE/PrpD family protein [Microvirga puerhi]MBZ6078710.1 MmgE/PrpD family protein [Microvirga puerhi]